jgi:hypothetical protein
MPNKKQTADEDFFARWCERSGLTVEQARFHGLTVLACDCGEKWCEGFVVVNDGRPRILPTSPRPGHAD